MDLLKLSFTYIIFLVLDVKAFSENVLHISPTKDVVYYPIHKSASVTCSFSQPINSLNDLEWIGPKGPLRKISKYNLIREKESLIFIIPSPLKEDSGIYTCITNINESKYNSSIIINFYDDIEWSNCSEEQNLIFSSPNGFITCIISSSFSNKYWRKNNIPLNNKRYQIVPDGIKINGNVSWADAGVYQFSASLASLGTLKVRNINVVVMTSPVIKSLKFSNDAIEDQPLVVQCNAAANPPPIYNFFNSSGYNLQNIYDIDSKRGRLVIHRVTQDLQTAEIVCSAENSAGRDTSSIAIKLLSRPKIFAFENKTVIKGEFVEWDCEAKANPLANMSIRKLKSEYNFREEENSGKNEGNEENLRYKNEILVRPNKFEVVLKLIIEKVNTNDSGEYICESSNNIGKMSSKAYLNVDYAPYFEMESYVVKTRNRASLNLTCIAKGKPEPIISWLFNGKLLEDKKIVTVNCVSHIELTLPDDSSFGIYRCIANNIYGSNYVDIKLEHSLSPDLPDVSIAKLSSTNVQFKIKLKPDEFDLKAIHIQYVKDGYNNSREYKVLQWKSSSNEDIFKIGNLLPRNIYYFQFANENFFEIGNFTKIINITTLSEAEPDTPEIILSTNSQAIYDRKLWYFEFHGEKVPMLRWQIPEDNGAPIDFYQIIYNRIENRNEFWINSGSEHNIKLHHNTTEYSLNHLKNNTHYLIQLSAHNIFGYSSPSSLIIYLNSTAERIPNALIRGTSRNFVIAIVVVMLIIIDIFISYRCKFGMIHLFRYHMCYDSRVLDVAKSEQQQQQQQQQQQHHHQHHYQHHPEDDIKF